MTQVPGEPTNPPPAPTPPADPPAPPIPPAPPTPTQPPAPTSNPANDLGTFFANLSNQIAGLPEHTAHAVREAMSTTPPNQPAATGQPATPATPAAPVESETKKVKGGPSRVARWWHGMDQ